MLVNHHPTSRFVLAASALVVILSVSPAPAQDDIGMMVENGLRAMKDQRWEEALQIHAAIVDQHGKNNPLQQYGPQFGNIYYRKGMCELKLKQFNEAFQSFEITAQNFPNAGRAGGGNQFEKLAILRKGEAQMGLEQWQEALANFDKFLHEKDKTRDKYGEGLFHLSLAICHYKLHDMVKGNENLEIAIRNKVRFETPPTGIIAAFQAMVEIAIAKKNEAAITDFIAKNRGDLTLRPYAMQDFSRVFMNLAAKALAAQMLRAAIDLYHFVPGTDHVMEDLKLKIASMGNARVIVDGGTTLLREKLDADLKRIEEYRHGKSTPEMDKLAAIAFVHEVHGNIRGALAAYQQLETYYPHAAKREDYLYNLVRISASASRGVAIQKYGDQFLKEFPNSKHAPAVKKLKFSTLFYEGKYELCIEMAEPMLPALTVDTPEHDTCLHMLGGSYFYTGQYDKAQPLLDQHVEKYKDSEFAVAAQYFQASNMARLQQWTRAGALFDTFLTRNPDPAKNIFLPFALYDRASCHYAEEKYDEALVAMDRITNEFPECIVLDQAWGLRGNIQQSKGDREGAEKSYAKAFEIAEGRKHTQVAAGTLYSLISLLSDNPKNKERFKDAAAYADKYWNQYSEGSPYNARVAVVQFPALVEVGRNEEALERFRKVIIQLAKDPQAQGLEELINSYTEAYLAKHTPEQLKEHYYNFPEISIADRAARALLRVAIIGVFEGVARKSEDEVRKKSAEAMITVLFRELKSDFQLKDLTNFILVRVGDFLRTKTATPREALPYYDEVLGRQDQSMRFNAMIGRGDIYGQSSVAADLDKGIADFTCVYNESKERPQRELALYRMVDLLMLKKNYTKAAEQARIYLDREKSGFTKYSPKVGLLLAQSFDRRDMTEDAISMYVKIWSVHMGNIMVSAPAITRWMELLWERNKPGTEEGQPSDRQAAYVKGHGYLDLTARFKEKMKAEELELWNGVERLVQNYEKSPGIKSMEQTNKSK